MNDLPQELVDRISSFLDREDLRNTLLLSRSFHFAAEEFSGVFRHFNLTSENANSFISTFSGRRFAYLRELEFETILSPLEKKDESDSDYGEGIYEAEADGNESPESLFRDTPTDLREVDEEFTAQINFLFSTMRTVETNVEKFSHSTSGAGNIHLTIFTPTREVDLDQWDLQRCFVSWRVHLLSPQNLSTLTSIRTLSLEAGNHTFYGNGPSPSLRKLDGRVLLDLAAKLPNLSALKCKIGADEWYSRSLASEALRYITQDWAGPRRDSRHDFSKAIDVTALPSLRHAHLDFLHPLHVVEGIDQRITLPNLSFPAAYDPFSTSLRQLSQNLRTMHLRVVADPTLFWPIDGDNLPFWPNLEHIHVEFHMSNPVGSWYFKGPQGLLIQDEAQSYTVSTDQLYPPLSDTEKDVEVCEEIGDVLLDNEYNPIKYRVEPNEDTIIPFLTAFAKAAS